MNVLPENLPLARLQQWASERPDAIFFTQPMGQGAVRDFTFAEVDAVHTTQPHFPTLREAVGATLAVAALDEGFVSDRTCNVVSQRWEVTVAGAESL